jgi:hypothetical protein
MNCLKNCSWKSIKAFIRGDSELVSADPHGRMRAQPDLARKVGKMRRSISWLLFPVLAMIAAAAWLGGCGSGSGSRASVPLEAGVTQTLGEVNIAPLYYIDEFGSVTSPDAGERVQFKAADAFHIKGWAVDEMAATAAGGVEIVVDGEPYRIAYGTSRPDVAQAKNVAAYANSGFEASFPAQSLGPGEHRVSLRVLTNDRQFYYATPAVTVLVH